MVFRGLSRTAYNSSGGKVVELNAEEKLVKLALTSVFNDGLSTGNDQIREFNVAAEHVTSKFLAQCIIYAYQTGHMRDTTAYMLALLSKRDTKLFRQVFAYITPDGRMLRNFVGVIRSGLTGRKSLGSACKAAINSALNSFNTYQWVQASIGNNPSIKDVIKLSHYKPNVHNDTIVKWILGYPITPDFIDTFNKWDGTGPVPPHIPFEMYVQRVKDWSAIVSKLSYKQLIINLNTLLRNGVTVEAKARIVERIQDKEAIENTGWFPFRFFTAAKNVQDLEIRAALLNATIHALHNVPVLKGKTAVCPDVSGSMNQPATGHRKGATTDISAREVAALFSTALALRVGNTADIFAFDTQTYPIPADTFWKTVTTISNLYGGGTDCTAPIRSIGGLYDTVILISDNESWAHFESIEKVWDKHKRPGAKLVNWDLAPTITSLVNSRDDILSISGFNGSEFTVISDFIHGDKRSMVERIKSVVL